MEDTPNEQGLPRYSFDLIKLLDETVDRVQPPRSSAELANFRDNLDTWMHNAGRRSLVDELVAMVQEMENEAQASQPMESDAASSNILDTPILNANEGVPRRAPAAPMVQRSTLTVLGDDDPQE